MPVLNSLIYFPPNRRTALVRHVAKVGNKMPNEWRKRRYWQQRVTQLRNQMAATGMRPRAIELEIIAFRAAVHEEVQRLRGVKTSAPATVEPVLLADRRPAGGST